MQRVVRERGLALWLKQAGGGCMQRVVRRGACFWLKQAAEPESTAQTKLALGGQPASVSEPARPASQAASHGICQRTQQLFQASLAVAPISTDESETRGGQAKAARPARGGGRQGNGGLSLQGRERLPVRRGGLGKGGHACRPWLLLGLGKSLPWGLWLLGDQGLGHSFTLRLVP